MSGAAAGPATDPVLARFLRSLAARDASPHTQRAYATAVGAYLDWLAARGTDWRRPSRADLRAYLGVLGEGRARSSVAQRLAAIRSFHRWATRERPGAGRPMGRDRHAAPAAPAAARPRGRAGRRAAGGRRRRPRRPSRATTRSAPRSRLALALRDRALVETAYAAGLRISELASADARRRSTCGAARSGSWARGARSGSGCSGARRARRSPTTSRTAGRSCSTRRAGDEPPPAEIFLNHLGGAARRARPALPLDRLCARAGLPVGRLAAHAAPLVRDAPARRRRRPARRPGAARPREPGDDPDLHARLARPTPGRLSGGPSAGASRPRPVTAGQALARAGTRRLGRLPRLAPPRLGPLRRHRQLVRWPAELDTFFAAFRLPDLIFQLVAAGRAVVGADPDRLGAARPASEERTPGASSRPSST